MTLSTPPDLGGSDRPTERTPGWPDLPRAPGAPGASGLSGAGAAGDGNAMVGWRPPGLMRRVREPLLAAGAVGALGVGLLLRDPHAHGSWGYCPFLVLIGHPCPACGGLRAISDLLHGDVVAALGSNAYVVGSLALGLVLWAVWLARRVRDRTADWTPFQGRLATMWFAGLVVFGALRLFVPGLAFLQP